MKPEERRESYRMAGVSKAVCSLIDGSHRYQGILRNLSRTGFFFETSEQPQISKKYGVEIILEGAHSRLVVDNLDGIVTRNDVHGAAVEFANPFEWLVLAPIFYQDNRNG